MPPCWSWNAATAATYAYQRGWTHRPSARPKSPFTPVAVEHTFRIPLAIELAHAVVEHRLIRGGADVPFGLAVDRRLRLRGGVDVHALSHGGSGRRTVARWRWSVASPVPEWHARRGSRRRTGARSWYDACTRPVIRRCRGGVLPHAQRHRSIRPRRGSAPDDGRRAEEREGWWPRRPACRIHPPARASEPEGAAPEQGRGPARGCPAEAREAARGDRPEAEVADAVIP